MPDRAVGHNSILRLIDSSNAPVDAATVRCTMVSTKLLEEIPGSDAWWELVESCTTTLHSLEGTVDLAQVRIVPSASFAIVWISHPHFMSSGIKCDVVGQFLDIPPEVKLEKAPQFAAIVEDTQGQRVPEAEVTEMSTAQSNLFAGDLRDDIDLVFRYVGHTDTSGQVDLMPRRSAVILQATKAEAHSRPWRGECEGHSTVSLVLRSSFQVRGVLNAHGPSSLSNAWVSIGALQTGHLQSISKCLVRPDGSWGPVAVPLWKVDQYSFQLHAVGFVAEEIRRAPPQPGELLQVDFTLESGITFPVHVTTEGHEPINAALVEVGWQRGQDWTWSKTQSNEQGLADCGPFPAGPLHLEVSHNGYVQQYKDELYFKESSSTPVEIALPRGSELEGRTTFLGRPVDTFVVEFSAQGLSTRSKLFEATHDGHFRFDELPSGQISVVAHGLDGRRSDAHKVLVSTIPTSVELELLPALRGVGRVIDAITSEPLTQATVQPWDVVDGFDYYYSAPPCKVDSDGHFDYLAFSHGLNSIELRCPGYSPQFIWGLGVGDIIDFGAIPLSRPAHLQITLDCDEDAVPWTYWTEVLAPLPVPIQAFPSKKIVDVRDAASAEYTVDGLYPDGTTYRVTKMVRGPATQIEIKARHVRRLSAKIIPPPNTQPHIKSCFASFGTRDGASVLLALHISDDLSVDLSTIPVEDFRILVVEDGDVYVADEFVHGASSLASPLLIHLSGQHSYVRVIDPEDAPIEGAYVMIIDPSDPSHSFVSNLTDTDGRATFSMPTSPVTDTIVLLTDRTVSLFPALSLNSSTEHPVTLKIDPSLSIRLRVKDGDLSVPGVKLYLTSSFAPSFVISTQQSNVADAAAVFSRLGKGEYTVSVSQEGIWPKAEVFRSGLSPEEHVFQIRRVGSVNIQVDKAGLAVAGASVSVSSVEFSTDVAEWLSESFCFSSTGSLTTNEFGKLRLDGLPHGTYRLETLTVNGETASGLFTVEPHRIIDATLSVP